ncbi:MAG: type II secretion system minor pseudopilin GspK [Pseudomonadota bacterium]
MKQQRQQRGVALITAILIMALIASLTYALEWDNNLDIRRTIVMQSRDQAIQVAMGAESWLASILRQDGQDSDTDHLDEIWATNLPPLPIEGGEVLGEVQDLTGRFNINNLLNSNGEIDETSLNQFRQLLLVLGLDPRLADLTADWVDGDQDAAFPDGAEDPIYTAFTPPYRTANQQITTISELAAIEGMDKASFDILAPHITAIPGRMILNANTATPAVLQSLHPDIDTADVEGLLSQRADGGFADVNKAFEQYFAPGDEKPDFDVLSNYFQLKVTVRIDTVRITYFSLLYRSSQGDVTPVLRSLGTI